jgi:hypothetical protein
LEVDGVRKVQVEIEALERVGQEGLRLHWRNRWGRLAPAHIPRALLFRLMAYRIQSGAFGDLDRQTAAALARITKRDAGITSPGEIVEQGGRAPSSASVTSSPMSATSAPAPSRFRRSDPPRILKPGAVMTREWRGRIERVMALEQGFAWEGKTFGSLSAVAFAITGVKWNGYRFFFGGQGRDVGDAGEKADGGRESNGQARASPKGRPKLSLPVEVPS